MWINSCFCTICFEKTILSHWIALAALLKIDWLQMWECIPINFCESVFLVYVWSYTYFNFLLKYSWFTMLCYFLVYSKEIQLYIDMYKPTFSLNYSVCLILLSFIFLIYKIVMKCLFHRVLIIKRVNRYKEHGSW